MPTQRILVPDITGKRCLPWMEPHTVDLMALPDPYVVITPESMVVGPPALDLFEVETRYTGKWAQE